MQGQPNVNLAAIVSIPIITLKLLIMCVQRIKTNRPEPHAVIAPPNLRHRRFPIDPPIPAPPPKRFRGESASIIRKNCRRRGLPFCIGYTPIGDEWRHRIESYIASFIIHRAAECGEVFFLNPRWTRKNFPRHFTGGVQSVPLPVPVG